MLTPPFRRFLSPRASHNTCRDTEFCRVSISRRREHHSRYWPQNEPFEPPPSTVTTSKRDDWRDNRARKQVMTWCVLASRRATGSRLFVAHLNRPVAMCTSVKRPSQPPYPTNILASTTRYFFHGKTCTRPPPRISHEKHTHPSTHNQTTLDAASDMTPDINVPFPQRGSRDRTLGHPSTLTRRYTYAHTCKNKCRRRLFTYNSGLALMLSVL